MIYECLIDTRYNKFIGAHEAGAEWGSGETQWPFEIGISEDVDLGIFDRVVRIHWSKGVLEVRASKISDSITKEARYRQEVFLNELSHRNYPINTLTMRQPIKTTGIMLGDLK